MTDETYIRIAEIYNALLQDKTNPVTIRFEEYSGKYWKLSSTLSREQWQIVNDCFCCFHQFYMAVAALAIEGKN